MMNVGTLTMKKDNLTGITPLLALSAKTGTNCSQEIKGNTLSPYGAPIKKEQHAPPVPQRMSSYRGDMSESMMSDYLAPQGGEDNSVKYYILENPAESGGKEEMYQSIHLFSSLERAPENAQ